MGAMKSWLMALVAVSMLCALAQALMPEGPVKKVGRLACGMVLLCSVLLPLTRMDERWLSEWKFLNDLDQKRMTQWVDGERKRIIEEKCSAYIQDTAEEHGLLCHVRICCVPGDGNLFLPDKAQVSGELDGAEWEWLCSMLEEQLGIRRENIFREEGTG